MLERMFEKQDNLKIISHPFSSSRGIQLAWMQSDCFEDGMTADARSKWSAEINKAIDNWRSELAATQRDVGGFGRIGIRTLLIDALG